MKMFIVLALFAAAASASVIQSPVVGYNTYGSGYGLGNVYGNAYGLGNVYGNTYGLKAGLPLVSGVRTVSPLRYASRVVAPLGVRAYRPVVSSPLVAPVAAYGVHSAAYGVHSVAPVAAYGINAAPLVSNVVAPSVYSNYGTGLYGNGYFGKKV